MSTCPGLPHMFRNRTGYSGTPCCFTAGLGDLSFAFTLFCVYLFWSPREDFLGGIFSHGGDEFFRKYLSCSRVLRYIICKYKSPKVVTYVRCVFCICGVRMYVCKKNNKKNWRGRDSNTMYFERVYIVSNASFIERMITCLSIIEWRISLIDHRITRMWENISK
jgi:hypothetical protein